MSRLANPLIKALDAAGVSEPGAKLYTYKAGTVNTPQTTYTDVARNTPHTNPIIADGSGDYPDIYLDPSLEYKFVLTDSDDVQIAPDVDYVPGGPFDADSINYSPDFTGSVTRTVEDRLEDFVSVNDFGAVGDGITDDTASIQAALDYVNSLGGGGVFAPASDYFIGGSTLTIGTGTMFFGDGNKTRIIIDASEKDGTPNDDIIKNKDQTNGNSDIVIRDLYIFGDRSNATNQYNAIDFVKCDRTSIVNVTFVDHGVAIWYDGGSYHLVDNCNFLEVTANKSDIVTAGSNTVSYLTITNSMFNGADNEAIDINGPMQQLVITDNQFYNIHTDNDDSGPAGNTEVIDVGDNVNVQGVVIANNIFSLNSAAKSAIWIKQGSSNVSISSNVMRDGKLGTTSTYTNALIMVSRSDNITISNNEILDGERGISITDDNGTAESEGIVIIGNILKEFESDGIIIDATAARAVKILGNAIDGVTATGNGISISNTNGLNVADNEIYVFDGDGVSISASVTYPNISNNIIRNSGAVGINIDASNAIVDGCHVVSSTSHGVDVSGEDSIVRNCIIESNDHGVNIAANRVQVGGCHIRNNDVGVDIPAAQIDLIVQSNYIKGNTTAQIDNSGNAGGSSIVADNIIV